MVNVASVINGVKINWRGNCYIRQTLGGIGVPIYALIDGYCINIGIFYVVKGYQELYNVYARFKGKEQLELIKPPNGALVEGYLKVLSDVAGTGRELLKEALKTFRRHYWQVSGNLLQAKR